MDSEILAQIERNVRLLVFENRQVAIVLDVDQLRPERPTLREGPCNARGQVVQHILAPVAESDVEVLVLAELSTA